MAETADLDGIEARIWALLDRYRDELEDATIYQMPCKSPWEWWGLRDQRRGVST